MIFQDMNRSWNPPENYVFTNIVVDGAYLRVEYRQKVYRTGTTKIVGENIVIVFVNDQGREVARSKQRVELPVLKPEPEVKPPLTRWARFCTGFYLVLAGLEEMIKCLRN